MGAKVYFLNKQFPTASDMDRLFEALDLEINSGDIVAVKVHMGEMDNITYVKPFYVKRIVELIKSRKGEPFVTDTTTIYGPMRDNALDYHKVALSHGFSPSCIGCPVIIADGLIGEDGVAVKMDLPDVETEIDEIEVARAIYESDAIVTISHVTGHGSSTFGGAIKNIGMGCVTKKGKALQHHATRPHFDTERCTKCGKCREKCAHGAIRDDYEIDMERCVGCALCAAICPEGAKYLRDEDKINLQRRIAEAAYLVMKKFLRRRRAAFLNFLIDITSACDCARSSSFLSENIGVLSSDDIVAVDKCALDLIKKKVGENVFIEKYGVDPEEQIERAFSLKMGEKDYEIYELKDI